MNEYKECEELVGLKEIVNHNITELSKMTPSAIIKQIDTAVKAILQYIGPRRGKLTLKQWKKMWVEIEIEYGAWSNILNKCVRAHMFTSAELMNTEKDPVKIKLNQTMHNHFSWAYAYWWNRFHYINTVLKSKSGLGGRSTKNGIEHGRVTLKKLINSEITEDMLHPKFKELIQNLKKMANPQVSKKLDNL